MYKWYFILSIACYIIYRILHKHEAQKKFLNDVLSNLHSLVERSQNEGFNPDKVWHLFHSFIIFKINYESFLTDSGYGAEIKKLEHDIKYSFECPNCNRRTDVSRSLRETGNRTEKVMVNGRYTKDGDLDLRYNTEFDYNTSYYFAADCNLCRQSFTVQMDERDYANWQKLSG